MYINKFNKIAIEYTLWSYSKIILNQIKLLQKKTTYYLQLQKRESVTNQFDFALKCSIFYQCKSIFSHPSNPNAFSNL